MTTKITWPYSLCNHAHSLSADEPINTHSHCSLPCFPPALGRALYLRQFSIEIWNFKVIARSANANAGSKTRRLAACRGETALEDYARISFIASVSPYIFPFFRYHNILLLMLMSAEEKMHSFCYSIPLYQTRRISINLILNRISISIVSLNVISYKFIIMLRSCFFQVCQSDTFFSSTIFTWKAGWGFTSKMLDEDEYLRVKYNPVITYIGL